MPPEYGDEYRELQPVKADEAMPAFLVQKGYKPGSVPVIRIRGRGNSFNFTFGAPLAPDIFPEQVEGLFEHRGATGSLGYVQREAREYLEGILSGSYGAEEREAA